MAGFLNLFGGNDTQSNTTTTENINFTKASGSQSLALNGNSGVVNYTNMDGQVAIDAMSMNGQVAIHAMDNNLTSLQDSLLFASDAQRQAYGFSADANRTAFAFADATNKAANATTTSAIGSASDAMSKALQFGSQQTGVALDALAGSATLIDKAYQDSKGTNSTTTYALLAAIFVIGAVAYVGLRK